MVYKRKSPAGMLVLAIAGLITAADNVPVILTFHEEVLVNDTLFTVGDLAKVNGDDPAVVNDVRSCIAGQSAPPGYGRFISTTDFVAMKLANRFPGVAFSVCGAVRPTIRTDYQTVTVGGLNGNLRSYLDSAVGWRPDEWQLEIGNPDDSCKCLNAAYDVSVSGLRSRYPRGNDNLLITLRQGSQVRELTARCKFSVNTAVLVAKHDISRGSILTGNDIEIRKMDLTRFSPVPFTGFEEITGRKSARTIRAGTIMHQRLVVIVPVVEKGEPVSIIYAKGRVAIAVSGIARENGGKGDRIWVENLNSHKLVRVIVKGKGKVHVLQGEVTI